MIPESKPQSAVSESKEVAVLLEAFRRFEDNARRLEAAYRKMQEDFNGLNLELDRKNNLLSHILQHLTNAVVAIDNAGCITSFNQAAERLTGFPPSEVQGKKYADILGKEVAEELTPLDVLKTGGRMPEREKTIINRRGEAVPVSFTATALEDKDGQRLGALEVLRDLSEVKRMEEELQRNKTLAAMGELSAQVAHEIRNPLGAIAGCITLLERDLSNDLPKLDLVKKIIRSIASMNKIVGNLLVYTRPLMLQKQEVDLRAHLDQVLDFVSLGLDTQKVRLNRAFPEGPAWVAFDPEKVQQAVINLVQNAVHALGGAGEVSVRVMLKRAEPGRRLFVKGLPVKRWAAVSISDAGCGIPEENMKKLFNPFFTTREDGTGLGLAIVKKIMDLHDGEITVKSAPGKGTTFTLLFPGEPE